MDHVKLNLIREQIEKLELIHQKEVLKIFLTNNISFTENRNGTFINISNVPLYVLQKIKEYLIYVYQQNEQLNQTETIKEMYKRDYFKKDNKDTTLNYSSI